MARTRGQSGVPATGNSGDEGGALASTLGARPWPPTDTTKDRSLHLRHFMNQVALPREKQDLRIRRFRGFARFYA